MSETPSTMVIEWGADDEDAQYVCEALEQIQRAGSDAKVADSYAAGLESFVAAVRGAATMLGLAIPARDDVLEALVPVLRASSAAEQAKNAELVRAGKPGEASVFSGCRGWLDAAWSSIVEGQRSLGELKDWEDRRKK
jgi:hypothetical protein